MPAIRRLRAVARAHGLPVVYTQDWHRADDPEFALWGPHAVAGTIICVLHTTGSAALRWFRIVVPVDATSPYRGTLTRSDGLSVSG